MLSALTLFQVLWMQVRVVSHTTSVYTPIIGLVLPGPLGVLEVNPEVGLGPGPDPEVGVIPDLLPLEVADAADEVADVKV